MRWLVAGAVAVLVAIATAAAGYAIDDPAPVPLGPGLVTVEIDVEHSRFSVDDLTVAKGTIVRFVVVNGDPINHELVVGDRDVHARHEQGREAVHPPVPGEVSVGPGERGVTFYEFDDTGTFDFACHLPRHAEFGMVGEVHVV